jgi:hypothetical protein
MSFNWGQKEDRANASEFESKSKRITFVEI